MSKNKLLALLALPLFSTSAHAIFFASTNPQDHFNAFYDNATSGVAYLWTHIPGQESTVGSGCTGSAISKRLVLTAAHCVYGKDATTEVSFYDPLLGVSRSYWGQNYYNPSYDVASIAYDTALIVLGTDLPDWITKFSLYSGRNFSGLGFAITGYGQYGTSGHLISPVGDNLFSNNIRYMASNTFTNLSEGNQTMQARFDNLPGEGVAAPGDSGGPAFRYYSGGGVVQAGVASYFSDNGNHIPDFNEVMAYSLVSSSMGWLNSYTNPVYGYIDWTANLDMYWKNGCPTNGNNGSGIIHCKGSGYEGIDGSPPVIGGLIDPKDIYREDPINPALPLPSTLSLALLGLPFLVMRRHFKNFPA